MIAQQQQQQQQQTTTAYPAGLSTLEPLPPAALGQPPQQQYAVAQQQPQVSKSALPFHVAHALVQVTRVVQLPSQPLPQARVMTQQPGTTTVLVQQPQTAQQGNIRVKATCV